MPMPTDRIVVDESDESFVHELGFRRIKRLETKPPKNRNVIVNGRRTSMRLEETMWEALNEIAARERVGVGTICSVISNANASMINLTSAVRTFIAAYFRESATDEGHSRAGHGLPPERTEKKTTN